MRTHHSFRLGRLVLLALVALLLVAVVGVWWWRSAPGGMNPLESWCASQVRRIAGDLLAPKFDFSTLELELPATVTLKDVSLTSDGTIIVEMSSMRLEFRDPPERGHPLVIQAATFVDPHVNLVERADGTLQGFGRFMKSTSGERYADGGSSKPSDFLAIRQIAISGGTLVWNAAGSAHPMVFDQLGMNLATSPDASRPGWYAFDAHIDRAPVVQLGWKGGISIDTGDLAFDDMRLRADLSRDDYSSLTPSVQALLRQYDVVGELTLGMSGRVPLGRTSETNLKIDASLRHASATIRDHRFPIDAAVMKATIRDMEFAFAPLSVHAFNGTIDADGTVGLADDRPFTAHVRAKEVLIQDMFPPAANSSSQLAGKVDLRLDLAGSRSGAHPTMTGDGSLQITDGLLLGFPVVDALANALKVAKPEDGANDRGEIDFTIENDRARVTRSMIQSMLVAARGTGDVSFDGRLDLRVNAGVIERAESILGPLGDLLGALTDRLLPWHVSGTWSDPIVRAAPLGLGAGPDTDH
ncbi:MAG: hypothetical protein KDA22_07060 [Phycisphaerales bacterium]|nr:hypothetical protein [Phycisphaerales bacterium]